MFGAVASSQITSSNPLSLFRHWPATRGVLLTFLTGLPDHLIGPTIEGCLLPQSPPESKPVRPGSLPSSGHRWPPQKERVETPWVESTAVQLNPRRRHS